jgi:IS1 family transposase/transposase-like protein
MYPKPLNLLIFLVLCFLWIWLTRRPGHSGKTPEPPKPKQRRRLRPRTPNDCAQCRAEADQEGEESRQREVIPWSEVKSPRGRKKRIDTEGQACSSKGCDYRGITDASIHALVGYGSHSKSECIQDLFCQACKTKFTVRRDTPLYRLKTPAQRVGEVLSALAEGLDVAASVRVFGHTEATIQRWLTRAGMHAERLHDSLFHGLHLQHVQLDELKTRLRQRVQEVWLWVAIDVTTKVIATVELGARTQVSAHRLIHGMKRVLAENCLPVFTSDGLRMYFYALTAHFGYWCPQEGRRKQVWIVATGFLYGQVIKRYRRRRTVGIEYRMQWGRFENLKARLKALGLSGKLNTAYVERVNLTLRQGIAPLIRRTWGTAQTLDGLRLHLEWWRAYYHFIRPHMSLREELSQPIARKGRQIPKRYRARTPAMAVGITDHRWTAREFLSYPLPEALD